MDNKTIYCGSGKTKTGKFGEFFSVSICLSDLQRNLLPNQKTVKST